MKNILQGTMEKNISEKQFKRIKSFSTILFLFSWVIWIICIIGVLKNFDLWLFLWRGDYLFLSPLVDAALISIALLGSPLLVYIDIKKIKSYPKITEKQKAIAIFNQRCKSIMYCLSFFASIIVCLYASYPSAYHKSWVWFYSFGGIGSVAILKMAVTKNLKGEKFSVQTIIDFAIEIFKLCLLLAITLITLKSDAAVQSTVRDQFNNSYNFGRRLLAWLKFFVFIDMLFLLMGSAIEYENSFTDAKKLGNGIWAIAVFVILEFLFVVFYTPSNGDTMQLIRLGITNVMEWSLPLLLLWIIFWTSAKFPSGKEIHEDIKERVNRRRNKAIEEANEILSEKEPAQNSNNKE